jgi:OOP family OmpA-OmpF porin
VSRCPAERAAVAAAATALAVAAVALAAGAPAPGAQEPPDLPATGLTLPVADLSLTVAALDDSVATTESARRVRVTIAADALFEVDRAALLPGAQRRLGDVARRIGAARPQEVSIEAHTDGAGTATANERLSERRAESVARGLEDLLGAAAPTLDPIGLGERRPVAPGRRSDGADDPRGHARNRRVTIDFPR